VKQWERIPNSELALERCVSRFRKEVVERLFWGAARNSAVEYVFVELLNNAFEHGNQRDEAKAILIEWELEDGTLTLSVQDEGNGFIPQIPAGPPPLRQTRGRGRAPPQAPDTGPDTKACRADGRDRRRRRRRSPRTPPVRRRHQPTPPRWQSSVPRNGASSVNRPRGAAASPIRAEW